MMMNFDFDAAIFDLDSTLLDTQRYWRYTSLEYLLAHGMPVSPETLLKMNGLSSRKLLPELARQLGIALDYDAMERELDGYMDRHYRLDAPLKTASVPAFLERLKGAGVRMCVATVSPCASIREALERLDILRFFDDVFTQKSGKQVKNDPSYFTDVLARMGATADRAWVFEDALYAMRSAKAAGLRVCAIREDTQAADWPEIQRVADLCIDDYAELL